MKRKINLLILSQLFVISITAQYQLSITHQSFNYSSKQVNIMNKWSWMKISLSKQITPKYFFGIEGLMNSSYLFLRNKNSIFFNEIPRGRNSFQNIGFGVKNELIIKEHENIVTWSVVNSTSFFKIPIYSTEFHSIDSINYYYVNSYTSPKFIFTNSIGLRLKARVANNTMIIFQYGLIYTHLKDSYSNDKNILRGNLEFGLIYSFNKKED